MAKSKKNNSSTEVNNTPPPPQVVRENGQKTASGVSRYKALIAPLSIALVTFLFLRSSLGNYFLNWDDPGYVTGNPLVKSLAGSGIKNIFTTDVMGNYHPLTILSYALEYSATRFDPFLYHLDSLLLHIGVSMLVYWLVMLLARKNIAAIVTSSLFALHPMHMESVTWVSGRKDPLYGLFFIAACICHVYFTRQAGSKKWRFYAGTMLLFLLALLSKPVAVTLPLTLLLIDIYERRKPLISLINEKIPLFALSIIFGIQSIRSQNAIGTVNTVDSHFNFFDRLVMGCYALITYVWKAVLPVGLRCLYPYPKKINGGLPIEYYLFFAATLVGVFLVWWFFRKSKMVIFGALFFIVNIVLLLQFIPVGGAIVAERYSYVPYFGLFFIAGSLVAAAFEPDKEKFRNIAIGASVIFCLMAGFFSIQRCEVWHDNISLWKDEIEKQPNDANAFNNLGDEYNSRAVSTSDPAMRSICFDSAIHLYKEACKLDTSFINPVISLGVVNRKAGNIELAKTYFYKAIKMSKGPDGAKAYVGLAILYFINKNFDSSGYYFRAAVRSSPTFPDAHANFANLLDVTGKTDSALAEYGIAIKQAPDLYEPYVNRGRALIRNKKFDAALKDFDKAIELNPESGEMYYARSFCYAEMGNKAMALKDVETAISMGYNQIDNEYYQRLRQ